MALAICFKCGSAKSGALVACRNCKVAPKTNSEYAVSLALSDHISTKEQLTQYSHELRTAKKLSVPSEALTQAFDALKDPQLLAMLGAQSSAHAPPAPTPTPPRQPPTTQVTQNPPPSRSIQPGPDGRVTYSSGQSFDENVFKKIQSKLVELMNLKIKRFPVLLQDKTLLPKVDVQFMGIYDSMEKTHSLEQIVDESFRRAFPPSGIPPSGQATEGAPTSPPAPRTAPPPIPSKPAPRFAATVLNKSPFAVLSVTTRDDRRRIVELAEEKSLELDHELCQKARSDLTNPRTRLGAEIAWLPGVSPRKASQLVEGLLQNPMAVRQESGLPTLAHLNLMASAFETVKDSHDSDDLAEFIQEIANLAEELYPEEVLRDINEDRSVSGFPEVKTVEQIEEELSERKRYYRNAIKEALDRLPSAKLVQVMTDTVDGATLGGEDHAPSLIDDLVDSYEVETQSFLQTEAEKVQNLIKAARDVAESGEAAIKSYVDKIDTVARNWDKIAQPIQLSSKARGIDHDSSRELAWAIRNLAIDLFNKHDMLKQSQRLTNLIQEIFAEVPDVSEWVGEDAATLADIQQRLNESAAIDPIRNLVEGVLKDIDRSPGTANNDGERLLNEGLTLLKSAPIKANSPTYREAQNMLAAGIMQCAIAFGNQTSKWAPCMSLLQKALELASDTDLRKKLNENLTIVRGNYDSLGDLEPIKKAPSLHTINGIGTTLYGNTDPKPDGSHMATYYFVFFFIPIFPISRYRVIPTGGGYRFLGKGSLRPFDYWHIAISIGLILFMFIKG